MPYSKTPEGRKRNSRYQREWYRRNSLTRKQQVKERRRIIRAFVQWYKHWAQCKDCGERYPYCVMDFDHVEGKKLFRLGDAGTTGSWKLVFAEMAKCEVVCANCHRLRTHGGRPTG